MNSAKLRELLDKLAKESRAILAVADSEDRDLTPEEETEFTAIDQKIDATKVKLARALKLEAIEAEARTPVNSLPDEINHDVDVRVEPNGTPEDFENVGEFFHSVRYRRSDPRLVYEEFRGDREEHRREDRLHSMGTGTDGGYMIPKQFVPEMKKIEPDRAIYRPRAQVIPAGSPPDSSVEIPALDQSSAQNIHGGMVANWTAEGAAITETNAKIKMLEITPREASAYVTVTDKLLRNWAASSTFLTQLMRGAMLSLEETAFYNGNGVGKPLGVLQSPCRINYSRATANQIAYADIIGMFARILMRGGNYAWVTSQTTIPQLANMTDPGSGGTVIWQPNAREGMPGTLMGIPVMFSERSVGLGTAGDLVLLNLLYYLIKDGSGPFVAASEHVNFLNNKTVIKIVWNVDGMPWMNEPLPLEGSTTNTVSPIVVLGS
jgi:HK97 family phage major capsid protein